MMHIQKLFFFARNPSFVWTTERFCKVRANNNCIWRLTIESFDKLLISHTHELLLSWQRLLHIEFEVILEITEIFDSDQT